MQMLSLMMMTTIMLCAIEQQLKQAQNNMNPLLLLLGDLAQLPAICKHSLKKKMYCKLCHISMAPCWLNASHHILQTSMIHITDPIFLQFLIHILKNLHKIKLIMFCHVVMFQN